ncbi:mediator complex subunit 24 isoform X3 [Rhynchophorus ferrugineus]|uniref:mediator complex subunit 24 isoform X3 n=1 Tax=Rhynchophorus ferrugineus TaxID=354439 RepID=UPI003FCE6013
MVMESKTTSKTSSLKALLLRAWRERWTDLQWGINIKTVLPRGVSGDVYNLADCILQQAVVGTGANQLVLSYLRHSLSSQLVSHAAVLTRISKYSQLSKVHCVSSLLEFLEGMLPGVTCCGKPEETVLATAILSAALWLLNILQQCRDATYLIQKATELLKILLTDDFYISMICLAKYNDGELFQETSRKCTELLGILQDTDEVKMYVSKLENIDISVLCLPVKNEKWPGSLVQCWLEVKLIGNPGASTKSLADQLRIFQRLKGYNDSRLFAELIRGSLLALYSVNQTSHESHWGAFTFLKVPHILSQLRGKTDNMSAVNAVDLILQHNPLLDAMDAMDGNSSCSTLKCLLDELTKVRLLTEPQAKHLLEKRKIPPTLDLDNSPSTGIPEVIISAESTFSNILKTLSADYHKTQDVILGMIQQLLTGKNFELILAVACISNQLPTLVKRLIRFNECNKLGQDNAQIQLFDISFVMLIFIVQNYAAAVLDSDGNSLFEQWVNDCMVDRLKPKAPLQLLNMSDPIIVEALIQQFNSEDTDFKPTMEMRDILFNMPGVMREVLVAWEQGALVTSDVKRILDAVRGRMCCLPIAAATYLCSYMRTAPQEMLKPMNMVQQLLTMPTTEDDSIRVRWQLTCEIIKKMQRHIQLPAKSSYHLVSRTPAAELLHSTWNCGITKCWLDYNSAKNLHCLLDTAGARWLVNSVIQELLKLRFRDQLQRGVDIALAIFHVDITACTIELLSHILPQILNVDLNYYNLIEPQLSSLAYLTSYCLYTAWDSVAEEVIDEPPMKMPRLENLEDHEPETAAKKLIYALLQLLSMFERMQEGGIKPQTYFVFNFIKSLVEVKIQSANALLAYIPPSLISDLLKTLPDLFSYSMLLHLHDVYTTSGRVNMAKDLCVLRNYHLRKVPNVTN